MKKCLQLGAMLQSDHTSPLQIPGIYLVGCMLSVRKALGTRVST
jgi:hypothetical protein